jgi:enoyl-[acyl-carrier protein] reductase I
VKDPEPVARTVVFLLSDWARAITGEIVHVDGGYHAMGAGMEPQPRSDPGPVES